MKTLNKFLGALLLLNFSCSIAANAQTVVTINTPSDLFNYVGYICHDPTANPETREVIPPATPLAKGSVIRIAVPGNVIDLDVLIANAPACTSGTP